MPRHVVSRPADRQHRKHPPAQHRPPFPRLAVVTRFPRPHAGAPLQVIAPVPSDPYGQFDWSLQTDFITFSLVFNRPVRPETLVVGNSFRLRTAKDPNAAGTLVSSGWPNNTAFTFTSAKRWDDLLSPHPDDVFVLTLQGEDARLPGGRIMMGVRDEAGSFLDGDQDGQPGGNFTMYFTLIG